MNNFDQLRKLARDKRDDAIHAIKAVYQTELDSINSLEKKLTRKPSLKGRPKPEVPMHVQIMEAVPTDANFTVHDLLEWLELPASDKTIVRTTIDRLMSRHQIKRVRRGRRGTPALFAVTSFGPPVNPLNNLSQVDAAESVLRSFGQPVTITELALAMIEQGYDPVSGNRKLKKSLGAALGRKPGFKNECGLWSLEN